MHRQIDRFVSLAGCLYMCVSVSMCVYVRVCV